MSHNHNIRSRSALNAAHPCDYRKNGYGCPRKRKAVARYCEIHWEAVATTGHLDGKLIPRATIKPLQSRAAKYIASHRDHPGIVQALAYLQMMVIDKGRISSPPYRKPRTLSQMIEQAIYVELRRLQDPSPIMKGNGTVGVAILARNEEGEFARPRPVLAEDVLAVCVAVWLAVQLNSRLLVNDGECLNFALANGVLGLRKFRQISTWGPQGRAVSARPPGARVRRALGDTLRSLSLTFHSIAEKVVNLTDTPEQIRAKQIDAMAVPLPDAEEEVMKPSQRKPRTLTVPPTTPQPQPARIIPVREPSQPSTRRLIFRGGKAVLTTQP